MLPSRAAPSPEPPPTLRPRATSALIVVLLGIVVLLALVVAGDNAVTRADGAVVDWTAQHRPAWLVDAAKAVTLLGHGAILAVILVAVCAGLAWRGVLPARAALLPPLALAIGGGLNPLLKTVVDRPRPSIELRATVEHSSGFPSGHATQTAVAWVTLALALWLWGRGHRRWPLVAAATLAIVVGATRVILAVHSPTDVLAGWCWGTAVALTVVGGVAYAERSGAAGTAPSPSPNGDVPATGATTASPPVSER